jgi:transglutaminase-like putative cysteine protease
VHRRAFLQAAFVPLAALNGRANASAGPWRTFDVTTRVEISPPGSVTRAWLPLAYPVPSDYQRVVKQTWKGTARTLTAIRDDPPRTGILYSEWPAGEARLEVELTLTVATADRDIEWREPKVERVSRVSLQRYLQPTKLLPLDGIVRDTALKITRRESDDVGKARAIYEWIVENTERDPAVRGCGVGDIRGMLETKNFAGKCADLNGLFVGLVRAVGVPARDLFGLRVAPSRAFASLGPSGADVTTAQHCRAEFYSSRHGWVPVDPADVRKILLEEKPPLTLSAPEIQYARRRLFGSWEMNWIAFNDAHDVRLPHSSGAAIPFFMYPQAEAGGRRFDSLSPQTFRYTITARETGS